MLSLSYPVAVTSPHNPRIAKGHVPYRNNKLTMLMKDSIGGNVKLYYNLIG